MEKTLRDLSGLALKSNAKESGEISTVAVTTGMISGYNPNKLEVKH